MRSNTATMRLATAALCLGLGVNQPALAQSSSAQSVRAEPATNRPALAQPMTPPGTWMKVIKSAVRSGLTGGDKAKFSRVFLAGAAGASGRYPICGRVISQEAGDARRTMRYFSGVITTSGDFDRPAFEQVRVGLSATDIAAIWQTCRTLQLL